MGSSGAELGGVQSVSAADQTIIVSGGASAPTIKAHIGTTAGSVAAGDDGRFGTINGVTVTNAPTAGETLNATGPATAAWQPVAAGGVTSVTAADGTITVAGTAAAPTVKATIGTAAGTVAAGNDSRFGKATAAGITDATTIGKQLVTAVDAPTARAAIGAGTSSLTLGTVAGTALDGGTAIPAAATAAPAGLGAAAVGTSGAFARADHVHAMPTPAAVGAIAALAASPASIIVLAAADAVPAGTPAGTVIVRKS